MVIQKSIEETVTDMVTEIISDSEDLFLVKVILKGNTGTQKLIVLLDGDRGVTIDQCIMVSRALSAQLEDLDPIDDKYMLEVSSAGIDFPLQSLRQYQKNVGRTLKVTLNEGGDISGTLLEVKDDTIVLQEQKKKETVEHSINLNDISKSMVLVSFK